MNQFWAIPSEEYHPFYETYVSLVSGQDVPALLKESAAQVATFFGEYPYERMQVGYAPGKWSPMEVLGHMIDAERIFTYRAFRISRGDQTPLAGFEQNPYVLSGRFHDRNPEDLLAEYGSVRISTMMMIQPWQEDQYHFSGIADGHPVSLRAQIAILAGHEQHHLQILRERYL